MEYFELFPIQSQEVYQKIIIFKISPCLFPNKQLFQCNTTFLKRVLQREAFQSEIIISKVHYYMITPKKGEVKMIFTILILKEK